jgi:hypothetical protein
MRQMQLWQVDVGYACGGIEVDEQNVVQNAAPIFRWMVGKQISVVQRWIEGKRGTMRKVL